MPWNGSGTFSRQYGSSGWTNDKNAGTKIVASRHDINDDDLATGINQCLAQNGQNAATADLNIGSHRLTNVADGTASNDAATLGQVQNGTPTILSSVSGTDTITASTTPNLSAYVAGQLFKFVPAGANATTTPTLNINSLGAKNITKAGTSALLAGDIKANAEHVVIYDGTQFQLTNPLAPLSAYATLDSTTVAGGDLIPIYDVSATTNKAITVDNVRTTVGGTFNTIWSPTGIAGNEFHDFTIPSWARKITIMFDGVSLSGAADFRVQLGDSGGVETTTYISVDSRTSGASTGTLQSTSGWDIFNGAAARVKSGAITLVQLDASSNTWIATWVIADSVAPLTNYGGGSKAVSAGPVTTVRVTTTNGTDKYDLGNVNLFVE